MAQEEKSLIDGVCVKKLSVRCDERGRLMEILRSDDELFQRFGQVYLTTSYPGVVKAWHYHKKQTDHLVTINGMARIGLYDARKSSPTHDMVNDFFTGPHNPVLIKVPPMVFHGYKCIGEQEAMVLNIPTELYGPFADTLIGTACGVVEPQRKPGFDPECASDEARQEKIRSAWETVMRPVVAG